MPKPTDRLTHDQLRQVLTPSGSHRDEFVCPVCEHGHLKLFGEDGFHCFNDESDSHTTAIAKKLHDLLGSNTCHVPAVMPKPSTKHAGVNDDPNWQGLTLKQYCEAKKLSPAFLILFHKVGQRLHHDKPVVYFDYMDANGKVVFTRYRESLDTKPKSEYGSKMSLPYGLWLGTNKPDKSGAWPKAVFVCEGESNQQTLSQHGLPAIGVPGGGNWKSEWAELPIFAYAKKLYVLQDPDDKGAKFVASVSQRFPASKVIPVRIKGFKDVSDLHVFGAELGGSTFMDSMVASIRDASKPTDDWRQYFHTISELDQGDVKMLVKGLLPEGVTFLGSLSGVGKTWIALSLARALTLGKSFLGVYEVPEQHNVLYLVPEMGSRALRSRAEKMGLPDDDRFRCRTLKDGPLDLSSAHLLSAIAELKYVVFLDTAIRFTANVEENSSSANASGLANAVFELLRQGATAVVCLHHSPKAAGDADFMTLENVLRGTGDFGAMCDAVWGIQHAKKQGDKDYQQESNQLTRLFLSCVKPRDFEPADPFVIQGRPYINEHGDFRVITKGELNVNAPDKENNTELLIKLVIADPKISLRQLMARTGLHNDTVKKRLAERNFRWDEEHGWQAQPSKDFGFEEGY